MSKKQKIKENRFSIVLGYKKLVTTLPYYTGAVLFQPSGFVWGKRFYPSHTLGSGDYNDLRIQKETLVVVFVFACL